MADKRPTGRPRKGTQRRTVLLPRVEPWVAGTIDDDSRDGESRADTITRWAGERRDATENTMNRTEAAAILRNSIPRDCRIGRVCRDHYPEDRVTYWSAGLFPCDGSTPLGTVEFMEDGDDPVIHWR